MKYFLTHALITTALSLWLTTVVWAGFDEGVAAFSRGDYATAYEEWLPVAEQGNARAQFNLGVMYRTGQGVPQNAAEAVKWYCLAAEQGDANALLSLGLMYSIGDGVPQGYIQAHMWLNLAAAKGNESGRNTRGLIAEKMTPADISKAQVLAREWLEKHGG